MVSDRCSKWALFSSRTFEKRPRTLIKTWMHILSVLLHKWSVLTPSNGVPITTQVANTFLQLKQYWISCFHAKESSNTVINMKILSFCSVQVCQNDYCFSSVPKYSILDTCGIFSKPHTPLSTPNINIMDVLINIPGVRNLPNYKETSRKLSQGIPVLSNHSRTWEYTSGYSNKV